MVRAMDSPILLSVKEVPYVLARTCVLRRSGRGGKRRGEVESVASKCIRMLAATVRPVVWLHAESEENNRGDAYR